MQKSKVCWKSIFRLISHIRMTYTTCKVFNQSIGKMISYMQNQAAHVLKYVANNLKWVKSNNGIKDDACFPNHDNFLASTKSKFATVVCKPVKDGGNSIFGLVRLKVVASHLAGKHFSEHQISAENSGPNFLNIPVLLQCIGCFSTCLYQRFTRYCNFPIFWLDCSRYWKFSKFLYVSYSMYRIFLDELQLTYILKFSFLLHKFQCNMLFRFSRFCMWALF